MRNLDRSWRMGWLCSLTNCSRQTWGPEAGAEGISSQKPDPSGVEWAPQSSGVGRRLGMQSR